MRSNFLEPSRPRVTEASRALRSIARPLKTDADLAPVLDRIGDAHYVLLGAATHGTSEFHDWRARLSERLIHESGFSFIAVEADWSDAYCVDRYVKDHTLAGTSAREVLMHGSRWPTWMWANHEVAHFIERLHANADGRMELDKVGWYGLDVYGLWSSMMAVVTYLERVDPEAALLARSVYDCFSPYGANERLYARSAKLVSHQSRAELAQVLATLVVKAPRLARDAGRDAHFDAEQNALVAQNAEHYYRALMAGGDASWNVRESHMLQTLDRLMHLHGREAKCVVWAHNTHVADARSTSMFDEGRHNLGQLVRERYGRNDTVLVGFSTHRGTLVAGQAWDAPCTRMGLSPAREGSLEDAIHIACGDDALLVLDDARAHAVLDEVQDHRAIGVVYQPDLGGHYIPTILPDAYDVLLHVDQTHALQPLHAEQLVALVPETYPTGM